MHLSTCALALVLGRNTAMVGQVDSVQKQFRFKATIIKGNPLTDACTCSY